MAGMQKWQSITTNVGEIKRNLMGNNVAAERIRKMILQEDLRGIERELDLIINTNNYIIANFL